MISLAKAYEKYFRIGAAVSPAQIRAHHDLLLQHFNSLTADNAMKYEPTEPEEGRFRFEQADAVVAMAREMGIRIRAHAPVWHNQTPDWIYRDGGRDASPETIYERIDAHSKAMCERYGQDVYAWDVVNEATRDDPAGPGEDPVYRSSEYFRLCGAGFAEAAFRSLDRYAPDAQLFYNDYNEWMPEKRNRIIALIRGLRDRGCRVDGIGMQQHHFTEPDYDELKRSIEIYAGLDLRIHITELDISMMATAGRDIRPPKRGDPGHDEMIRAIMKATPEKLAKINEIYEKLFEIYRSYADVIDCVTTWGIADDSTWLDHFRNLPDIKQHPLLFDEQAQPKPCVFQLIRAAVALD
jgi:Beta-1,4-xylanase